MTFNAEPESEIQICWFLYDMTKCANFGEKIKKRSFEINPSVSGTNFYTTRAPGDQGPWGAIFKTLLTLGDVIFPFS